MKRVKNKAEEADRNHREKESWQAIRVDDFDGVAPRINISLSENLMYEAGYSWHEPGGKPNLTEAQEQHRLEWTLIHNPDKYELNDILGFYFRTVAYTDETPARIGEQRGMMRSRQNDGERYD